MFTVGEAAKRLGRTPKTLQRWDREGVLKPAGRSATGRRYYTLDQIHTFLGIIPKSEDRAVVVYCRVSSQAQKPDLRNQRARLEDFCEARGLANVEYIEEIGGGLNFKRPKFTALVDRIVTRQIGTLILAHKDRLARFGFDLLAHLCKTHQCELLIMNVEQLSPEREMVQDMLAIVHCFSARLYGLRNYKKALEEALCGNLVEAKK